MEPYKELHESDMYKFFADPLVFCDVDSTKPRLDISIELPIKNISFQKDHKNQIYYSKINITVNLKNSNKEIVLTKSYTESSSYSYTEIKEKSKDSQFYIFNYSIDPGNYKIEIELIDIFSNNVYKKSFDVSAKDYKSRETAFSDLMILSKIDVNPDGTKDITPLISNNVFGLKEIYTFFEIYNITDKEISKEFTVKLKDNKGLIIKEYTLPYLLTPGKNQKFESLFILKELRQYIPEEPQFDFYLFDNEQNLFFKLEILDKLNNEIVAQKKLYLYPDVIPPLMPNQPPPQRR